MEVKKNVSDLICKQIYYAGAGLTLLVLLFPYRLFEAQTNRTAETTERVGQVSSMGEQNSKNKKALCVCLGPDLQAKTVYYRVKEIADVLQKAKLQYSTAEIFVLPESAFPYDLTNKRYAYAVYAWGQVLGKSTLFLGACRRDGTKKYNTFYGIQKSRIIFYYDKIFLIPYFEYMSESHVIKNEEKTDLFLYNKLPFSSGSQEPCMFELDLNPDAGTSPERTPRILEFCPMICSEAFWRANIKNNKKAALRKKNKNITIVLSNDRDFCGAYYARLLKLWAQFCALEHNNELIYCSYYSSDGPKELVLK